MDHFQEWKMEKRNDNDVCGISTTLKLRGKIESYWSLEPVFCQHDLLQMTTYALWRDCTQFCGTCWRCWRAAEVKDESASYFKSALENTNMLGISWWNKPSKNVAGTPQLAEESLGKHFFALWQRSLQLSLCERCCVLMKKKVVEWVEEQT